MYNFIRENRNLLCNTTIGALPIPVSLAIAINHCSRLCCNRDIGTANHDGVEVGVGRGAECLFERIISYDPHEIRGGFARENIRSFRQK